MELLGLFLSAFTSATVLPGSSEVLLLTLLHQQIAPPLSLLLWATLGNTLGSITNYGLGFWARKQKPETQHGDKKHQMALGWLNRYGIWALLLTWLPLIGDALTLLAGWLRLPLLPAVLFMLIGKGARYALLLWFWPLA